MSEMSAAGGKAGVVRADGKAGAARGGSKVGAVRTAGGDRPAGVAALPGEPGVYRFRDQRDRVLYLGRAVNLRRRVASYWGDLGSRGHLARWWRGSPGCRRWSATPSTRPRGWSATCWSRG